MMRTWSQHWRMRLLAGALIILLAAVPLVVWRLRQTAEWIVAHGSDPERAAITRILANLSARR